MTDPKAGLSTCLGLSLVTAATVMQQIALTRVFSVIMWYHMSLVSVSLAMFGMTAGALLVHYLPRFFGPDRCGVFAALFSLSTGVSLALGLSTPFVVSKGPAGALFVLAWSAVMAVPFVFSGVVVCLCLTHFHPINALYASDLAGAAAGCLAVVGLLDLTDALTAVLVIGALAGAGAVCLAGSRERGPVLAVFLVMALGAGLNTQLHFVRLRYVLGQPYHPENLRHEFWNVFSYVTVTQPTPGPSFWGPGSRAPSAIQAETMKLTMDTRASTDLVRFDGDWDRVGWLLYDATNLAHSLRPRGPLLVIGAGGGRDVLSGLIPSRGQRPVDAVEINPYTVRLYTQTERDFVGLAALGGQVVVHNDEARSWIARSSQRYSVITIPLVDTFAASAAGAYALTENGLYTVEAFQLFFDHLSEDGVLSVSRWYETTPVETTRLVVLASEALRRRGCPNPQGQLFMARGQNISTLLVGVRPYSSEDLQTLGEACARYGFTPLLTPTGGDPQLVHAANDPSMALRLTEYHGSLLDFTAPTDDRPYFFHVFSPWNLFRVSLARLSMVWDQDAMTILMTCTLAVTMVGVAMLLPILKQGPRLPRLATYGFFALIGLGFMLFESAQMQRLSVFLGYPIYALTVVLFGLLLSAAIGAWAVGRLRPTSRTILAVWLLSLLALGGCGLASRPLLAGFAAATNPVRVAISLALIVPVGVMLGMMFPLGLGLARRQGRVSLPWCWGVNGTASTCSAIYGLVLSISLGVTATYWTSVACYLGAGALLWGLARSD